MIRHKIKKHVKKATEQLQKTPAPLRLLIEILICIVASLIVFELFWEMSERVIAREIFFFDDAVSTFFYSIRNPLLTALMRSFSFMGMDFIILSSLFIPIYFLWKHQKARAFLFIVMIGMGAVLSVLLKLVFLRDRPTLDPLAIENTYSFPSGHSMNSFIFFFTLAYFYYHTSKNEQKSIYIFVLASFLVIMVGVSRIYLGVHYPSDIVGGFLAGILWLLFIFIVTKTISFHKILKSLSKKS